MPKKFLILIVGAALLFPGGTAAQDQMEEPTQVMGLASMPGGIKVMTRNIYIGGDVDRVLSAEDLTQVPILAAEVFAEMQSTNFPERAEALADEIAMFQPHLIGIQEATTIYFQMEGDAVIGGTEPATDVLYKFLTILMKAIKAHDLEYKVVIKVKNADVEIPMYNPDAVSGFSDVRVVDYDVILARSDVEVSRKTKHRFQYALEVPGTTIVVPRGYVACDATIDGRTYRFVNTHLEPFSDLLKMAQAQELLMHLAYEMLPVILVGDFNTNGRAPREDVYKYIMQMGYVDAWTKNLLKSYRTYNKKGWTSGHDSDLRNDKSTLDQRIDHIWVRSNVWRNGTQDIGSVLADVVGDHPDDKTPTGLWPSDHAGVIVHIWIPDK
jgi:hypothetical protein